jgi:TonB family protein
MPPLSGFAIALGALAALAPAVSAQVIGGRVADRGTRLPARAVEVRVVGDSNTVVARAVTDTTGIFQVMLPAAGRVFLEFGIVGLSPFRTDTMTVGADDFIAREFLIELPRVRTEFEVEKQVSVKSGGGAMRYPPELKAEGVEGEVLASFVVDTTGVALLDTFRAIRSTDGRFTAAVFEGVRAMRFHPAEVHGQKVRQLLTGPRPSLFPRTRTDDAAFPPLPKYPGGPPDR